MPRVYNRSTTIRNSRDTEPPKGWVYQKEAAALLGRSVTTLKRRVKAGLIEEQLDFATTLPKYRVADIQKMHQPRERVF